MPFVQDFGFGNTIELPETQILQRLYGLIDTFSLTGPVMLIVHGADEELSYFAREMDETTWMTSFPTKLHRQLPPGKNGKAKYPVIIQDTQRLFAAFRAEPQYAQVALSRACKDVDIDCRKMYNAGELIRAQLSE